MKKNLFYFVLIVLVVFAVGGCRLTGPSDRDVFEAMEAVMSGFEASMDQDSLEINDAYANAAEGVFRNEDDSVVTKVAFIMNENSWYGDMGCSVELSGGKIETLEFSFSVDEEGMFEEYFITANDVEIDVTKDDNLLDILERFGRGMPG